MRWYYPEDVPLGSRMELEVHPIIQGDLILIGDRRTFPLSKDEARAITQAFRQSAPFKRWKDVDESTSERPRLSNILYIFFDFETERIEYDVVTPSLHTLSSHHTRLPT